MKKKILIFLLPIFIITLSCRTESESLENFKPNNEAAKRFALFPKRDPAAKDANSFRYDKAFAFLAGKYDSLNNSNITGLVNTTNKASYNKSSKQLFISKSSEAFIEFRIHSQAVFEENGDIWMLFPKIGKDNVEDLVVAILSEGQTKLHYKTISRSSDLFTRNVRRFRSAYSKYFNTDPEGNVFFMSPTSRCGFEGEAPCEIPEVIISPPPRDGGGGYHGDLPGNGDNPPDGGGCAVYLECEPDDQEVGGGGNGSQQEGDPCAKVKSMNTNTEYKKKVAELSKSSVLNNKHETGYSESKNGNFTELAKGISTESSDSMSMTYSADTKGYIHTHQNDYETGKYNDAGDPEIKKPFRMFSPADVNALMELAKLRSSGDYSDLYGTMISSYGNYTIKFTGTAADIKTGFEGPEWRKSYKKFMEEEKGSLETKFLRFMKEKMKINGISLLKTKNNGTVQRIEMNNKNVAKATDCN